MFYELTLQQLQEELAQLERDGAQTGIKSQNPYDAKPFNLGKFASIFEDDLTNDGDASTSCQTSMSKNEKGLVLTERQAELFKQAQEALKLLDGIEFTEETDTESDSDQFESCEASSAPNPTVYNTKMQEKLKLYYRFEVKHPGIKNPNY